MKRKELTKMIYDNFKLEKKTLWSPWFMQKYFSVVRVNMGGGGGAHDCHTYVLKTIQSTDVLAFT